MNKVENQTMKVKETKNRIKADFERTPLLERLRAKFINLYTVKKVVWYLFRFLLLLGISYVILFPFYSKIASSFMSAEDFVDVTVRLLPKHPTLGTYKAIIVDNQYFEALFNTFTLSLVCALLQTFVSCLVGYGFAKFKFKGNNILFGLVIFTMIIPHSTLYLSIFMEFRYFDILGIFKLLGGGVIESFAILEHPYLELVNTNAPLYILSATGLAYKNGLYIFLMRQFFKGIPDELEESAYLDGYGVFKTFFKIIIPLSVTMLITVFMFSFCWQWTDNFYTNMLYTSARDFKLLPDIVKTPKSIDVNYAAKDMYVSAIRNTCAIMIVAPLIVLYLFGQKYIVQGIERSGITG